MATPLLFDSDDDCRFAHQDDRFSRVLHIMDQDWFGIRSASACLPGHKLAISHKAGLDKEAVDHLLGLVHHWRINRLCFQAYSYAAHAAAEIVRKTFGSEVRIMAVTHSNTAQLEYDFEMDMLGLLNQAKKDGVLDRVASVKPGFSHVFPGGEDHYLINLAPRIDGRRARPVRDESAVFLPLETSWRKNLWTNALAALSAEQVHRIYSVYWPRGLEKISNTDRLQLTGFLSRDSMLAQMASVGLVSVVTLAECQPMTHLEALAVGTPCLTGPLSLDVFADDPLTHLLEVTVLDDPRPITAAIERVLQRCTKDRAEIEAMIDHHLTSRLALGLERWGDFLDI